MSAPRRRWLAIGGGVVTAALLVLALVALQGCEGGQTAEGSVIA